MPRTLPWLKNKKASSGTGAVSPASTTFRQPTSAPPAKRRRTSPASDTSNLARSPTRDDNNHPSTPQGPRLRQARTPSTSPPPRPPTPPSPLHDTDLKWRLVEDEFYTTAQLFTQHLHYEEYKRLKHAAKERGKNRALGSYSATTSAARANDKSDDGEIEDERAPMRIDFDDEDEDMVIADRNLKNLMFGTSALGRSTGIGRTARSQLRHNGVAKANTKASMGYGGGAGGASRVLDEEDEREGPSRLSHEKNSNASGAIVKATDDAETGSDYDSDDLDAPPRRSLSRAKTPPLRKQTLLSSPKRSKQPRLLDTPTATYNIDQLHSIPKEEPRSLLDDFPPLRTKTLPRHKKIKEEVEVDVIPTVFM